MKQPATITDMMLNDLALVDSSPSPTPVTPDRPRRELSKVLERLARAICARHNDCQPYDGYTNKRWPAFLPAADAAYKELLQIDQERATPKNEV